MAYVKSLPSKFNCVRLLLPFILLAAAHGTMYGNTLLPNNNGLVSQIERTVTLKQALAELERKHKVVFSYDSDLIKNYLVTRNDWQLQKSVEKAVKTLLKPFDLVYQKLGKNVIVIKAPARASDHPSLDGINAAILQVDGSFTAVSAETTAWNVVSRVIDRTISGQVTSSEDAKGLPGVSVVIKGTTVGTTTDGDGRFTFSIPDAHENGVLVFSFIGFVPQEVPIANRTSFNIQLVADVISLEEVVVIGYGTQKKQNMTGAVSTVNFEDVALSSRAVTNVSTMLAGMSSGIRVQQVNGLPSDNNAAAISIRGTGSLNASSAPLVVVDGQVADMNSVSPNDVASVSILKDAASAAIYGSRASNGVILITTKTGMDSKGKITFNYNNFVGRKTPLLSQDLVNNAPDYMNLVNMMRFNSGLAEKFSPDYIEMWREGNKTDPIAYPNTDWWDAVIKDNLILNHNFSARGGNDRLNFYTSVDYFKDDGLVPNTGFRRMNFRNNVSYKVNDWLKLGNNITVISTKAEPATINNAFEWMRATTPAVVPKHPDGRYGSGQLLAGEGGTNNAVHSVETQRGETTGTQIQGKIYGVLTPAKGLSITGSFFADLEQREQWAGNVPTDQWNFQTNQVGINRTAGSRLSISNSFRKNLRQVYDLYADYEKSIGSHNFKLLGGFNQESFISSNFAASRSDLLSYDTPVLDAAASDPQAEGTATDFRMRSFFGRLTYNFKGKYLLESNLRYDGSSRFAPEERWGLFPSFSVGWVLSNEDFWNPMSNTVNDLKLRVSWGQLGNNGIGNYEWQQFYRPANTSFNGTIMQGLSYSSFGNPFITWESTNVLNIGADMRLFNTLTLDLNYYDKLTSNILANLPIPLINGGIGAPRMNAAEVRNSGFEMEARYRTEIGKVAFSAAANFGYNKNRIVKYKGDLIEPRADSHAWTEGYPVGVYWVREIDHIVQDQAEIDAMIADGFTFHPSTPGAGDFLYRNTNGDKAINDDDRVLKGNPIPLYTYGGNVGVAFQGIDLTIFFDGVGKWDRYVRGSLYALNHQEGYQWPTEYMNAWTEQNPSTTIPKIYIGNPRNDQESDYYLHSAAYLKIRSIQLGYSLPSSLIRSIHMEKLRLFVNMENYFVFTNWPDMDPETTVSGFDQTYPVSRTISAGVSVSF